MEMKFSGMGRSIVGVGVQVKSVSHSEGHALPVAFARRQKPSGRLREPGDPST
jgi:hypothetical protein